MANHSCNSAPKLDQDPKGREWNSVFSNINRRKYDRIFQACLQEDNVERNLLDAFFQITESALPSREVEEAKKFVRNASKGEAARILTRAWVESRRKSTDVNRRLPEWLDPDQLSSFLKERSDKPIHESDAIRRLIYIPELTLDYILTLAKTASWNEVLALRAVLRRHIARQASIQVHIPLTGFLTFHLELSLPHLILRECGSSPNVEGNKKGRVQQLTTNLSFLNMESNTGEKPARFSIRKAHDTILLFGCDNLEWTGYRFSDHRPEEDDDEEEMPDKDIFASCGSDEVLDAYNTIWDPRVYFLHVVAIRIGAVLHEFKYLVQKLETGFNGWMTERIYTNLPHGQDQGASNKRLHEDTLQIKQVLHELRVHWSAAVHAWKKFSDINGDILHFADVKDGNARHALKRIKKFFADLLFLEQDLNSLDRLYEDSTKALSHQTYDLSHQTHDISLQINKLSKRTTAIALVSQKAAEETSRTTRVNVQIILTTTPFAIALQYFCSEQNLFAINRTPKTFLICLFVLSLTLPLITFVVEQLNQFGKLLYQKLIQSAGRNTLRKPNAGKLLLFISNLFVVKAILP
ncbi:uncharacterized protein K460DRAFT_430894 [Cucurbitaria berberidis CBS 394.84]|uniref:Uncharacterized protein n=1 Tax=Cucurbitaria berberidis CBS 394.84 TaxID=1168544 RepID=A0A9P4L8C3_9PLEO|nr:uncharacterized protein K460DRAFT_430894 [Cucurbitaria berberidis CBS 394.84]KAF1845931.1 hypothetical protein K460DRAFT_430894 [Cucurbitaria berberidis CBS 394.84]